MKPVVKKSVATLAFCIAMVGGQAFANSLNEVASQTVLTNPEVTSKWRLFRASMFERDVAWGRYLPTLDALYGVAREKRTAPPTWNTKNYTSQKASLTLKQNLFEGFATINDTTRLEHASLVRFYEMLDASETAAYEATRAYVDVWRYRQLLALAEDNYTSHRVAYERVKQRAQSGISGSVDLETAAGRLALAESNLLTERANLHDVSARYQRVVGELPADNMSPPPQVLKQGLPANIIDAINGGYENSPRLKAAFENILSAKRNAEVQKAGYMPRVDAYAEYSKDKNGSGVDGTTTEQAVGLNFSWNLFRGFQDKNKTAKAVEEIYYAKDIREKECREVRQNLSMSYYEQKRLGEQMVYQDQHKNSIDKVREAFRDQFSLNKRTLLDVLDAENEYYTAKRDYMNSEMDQYIANAKYFSTAGELLNVLDLKNLDMTPPKPQTQPDDDMFTTCPAEGLEYQAFNAPAIEVPPEVVPPPVPRSVKKYVESTKPVVIYGANFDVDKDILRPEADERLQTVVDFANDFPMADMTIIGHTDWDASDAHNEDLSRRRALAVKAWLVKKGVPANRLKVEWRGEKEPMADNRTAEGRAQNRRVEVHYTVTEKREADSMQ